MQTVQVFSPSSSSGLKPISFSPNWSLKDVRAPHFLLMGLGASIDDVVNALAHRLSAAQIPGMTIGTVREVVEIPGSMRTLRVKQVDRLVHVAVADVLIRRQGDDLYVKIQPQARSMLKHLRRVTLGTLFLLGWMGIYGAFFHLTDVHESFVREYVANYWMGENSTTQRVKREQLLSVPLGDLIRRDPRLALTNLGGPPAIVGAIVGGALAFAPRSLTTIPCRLLGWPTPEEFDALASGHTAWVEGTLGAMLLHEFGIHEGQRVSLQG